MTNKFRYLPLAVILSATPALAQEDNEQEIRIELESGGSPAAAITQGDFSTSVVGTPDGSVWYRYSAQGFIVYCSTDDEGEPYCKNVEIEI